MYTLENNLHYINESFIATCYLIQIASWGGSFFVIYKRHKQCVQVQ